MKITLQDSRTSVTLQQRDFRVVLSGARGPAGTPGVGIAAGGAEGQILAKASATDYDTEWIDNYAVNVEVYVKNSSGSPMTKGQIVYISGADGTNPTISLAIATTEMGSSKTIGWLKQDLAQGDLGYVITEGLLEGINTNAAGAAGDPVWLSPTTAGGVVYGIANKPSAPNHLVFLGYVLRKNTNNGKVYVKVQNGFELGELHDVYNGAKTTPVGNDALLLRDSADSNLWKRLTWTNALAGVKSHMDTFKSVANGYASLDGSGKVPASELPSYVDDVVEVANYAALPGTGETGKIYVTLDNNKCYRWTGSTYVEVSAGGASAWGAITGTLSSQTDLQTALDGKVDENAVITGATKTKITYDAKGLVTAGTDAAIADITGLQTALDGKQSTLSLTTTGTSGAATLVGSTLNIPQYQGVLTNPVTGTGTSGQVAYFNGTSAVTGSANLVFDGTRLGIGRTPTARRVEMQQAVGSVAAAFGIFDSSGTVQAVMGTETASTTDFQLASVAALRFYSGSTIGNIVTNPTNERLRITFAGNILINNTDGTGRLTVRGSGTTSSTTALLVQNSTPTELFKITDDGAATFSGVTTIRSNASIFSTQLTSFSHSFTNTIYSRPNANGTWSYYSTGVGGLFLTSITSGNNPSMTFFGATNQTTVTVAPVVFCGAKRNSSTNNTQALADTEILASWYNATTGFDIGTRLVSIFGNGSMLLSSSASASAKMHITGLTATSASNGLLVEDSGGTDTFTIRDDGGFAFKNGTVGVAQTGYTTFSNLTTDRTCDANATTVEELADILGTLIEDLKTKGIISA